MSKRRAILTLFRSTNLGCVAQAIASATALQGLLVNYVDEQRRKYYQQRLNNPVARATWETKLPLTHAVKNAGQIEELVNEQFDELYVGSDEILKFRTPRLRGLTLHPFPTPFWVSRSVVISKILWAASIGPVDYRWVDRKTMVEAMHRLSDFKFLSVRDMHTYNFIRHGSPELARRVEIVPDPTWLYWPRVLFDTPMRFMKTDGVANSFHNLVAHLMRGRRVRYVRDRRPKTMELARDFDVLNWNESRIVEKCLEYRRSAWRFARKVLDHSSVGTLPTT